MQRTTETRRLLIYIIAAVVAYFLGPRSIPTIGEDGTIDMSIWGAIFWWVCTIGVIVLILLIVRQLAMLSRIARYRPAR